VIVGDGPERERLRTLARSLGVADRVELCGQLPPERAAACAREATVFVLPSVEEAFGVAYIEAMAGGVPAIGCRGEDGPEEIAAAGGGIALVRRRSTRCSAIRIGARHSDATRPPPCAERSPGSGAEPRPSRPTRERWNRPAGDAGERAGGRFDVYAWRYLGTTRQRR